MRRLLRVAWASALVAMCLLPAAGCERDTGSAVRRRAAHPGALAVVPLDRTGSDGSFKRLDVSAPGVEIPAKLMVFKVKRPKVMVTRVAAQARGLGIVGKIAETSDEVRVDGASARFSVDKETGSFDFTTSGLEAQADALEGVLSDDEYRSRAEDFLADHGLMKPNAEFRDVNRGNVVGVLRYGEWVERPYLIEVRFSHKPLNGLSFDKGVGPKIVVQFGEAGRIVGAMSVWRDVEPYAEYPLLEVSEAASQVVEGDAQIFDAGTSDTGEVTDVELAYVNDPLDYRQRYVVPHFLLTGTAGSGKRFAAITRAVPRKYLEVQPELTEALSAPLSQGK